MADTGHAAEDYTSPRRANVLRTLNHLRWQIHHGCKDARCSTPTCFTNRLRRCRKNGKAPLRKFSELSALAIAFGLAGSSNVRDLLCPYVSVEKFSTLGEPLPGQIDPKSLMQQLCSTTAVCRFLQSDQQGSSCGDGSEDVVNPRSSHHPGPLVLPLCVRERRQSMRLQDLEEIRAYLDARSTSHDSPTAGRPDLGTRKARAYLTQVFESPQRLAASFTDAKLTTGDTVRPEDSMIAWETMMAIADDHSVPLYGCLRRALERNEHAVHPLDPKPIILLALHGSGIMGPFSELLIKDYIYVDRVVERPYSVAITLAEMIAARLRNGSIDLLRSLLRYIYDCHHVDGQPSGGELRIVLFVLEFRDAFCALWDESIIIDTTSTIGCLLEVLELLSSAERIIDVLHLDQSSGPPLKASQIDRFLGDATTVHGVSTYLDVEAACESWLHHSVDRKTRHILSYSFLFTKNDHWQFFRTACHSRMRKAVKGASFVQHARQRIYQELTLQHSSYLDRRLKVAQECYLVLKISRENILADALDQLWQRESRQLRKPLRVRLGSDEGEIGHDLGGVQIEFFKLLCREIFEGDQPLFTTDESSQLSWFRCGSLEPLYRYELIGVLFGLAIYNGITLPVSFPHVFYKKLMGYHCGQNDLSELWPDVHRSLRQIDEYTDDVETDLALEQIYTLRANGLDLVLDINQYDFAYYNPEIPQERKGRVRVFSARPEKAVIQGSKSGSANSTAAGSSQGSTKEQTAAVNVENLSLPGWEFSEVSSGEVPMPVTNDNRKEYISRYTEWLLDFSIRPQFYAFASGFYEVLDIRTMRILPPNSFRELVEGRVHIDLADLKRFVTYEGYMPDSDQIVWFWSILQDYTQEQLRLLLEFVTGSKRMPASGQQSLRFNVLRLDGGPESLPGASTCFGNLLLPEYRSREVMEEKLGLALEHTLGFGQA